MEKRGFYVLLAFYVVANLLTYLPDPIEHAIPKNVEKAVIEHAIKNETPLTYLPGWIFNVLELAWFVSVIGLALFQNWARHLTIVVAAGAMGVCFIWDWNVWTSFANFQIDIQFLLAGLVLGIVYFSPVSAYFHGKK